MTLEQAMEEYFFEIKTGETGAQRFYPCDIYDAHGTLKRTVSFDPLGTQGLDRELALLIRHSQELDV